MPLDQHLGDVVLQLQAGIAPTRGERHLPPHRDRSRGRLDGVFLDDQHGEPLLAEPSVFVVSPPRCGPRFSGGLEGLPLDKLSGQVDDRVPAEPALLS